MTPWTSSEGMRQAAITTPNYTHTPTYELERLNQEWMRGNMMGPDRSAPIKSELSRRYREAKLAFNWSILEREGFGL